MNAVTELLKLDISSLIMGIFILIVGIKELVAAFAWLMSKLGVEFKWMRKRNEDHELVIETSQKLNQLEEQRKIDVEQSIRHDRAIKSDLLKVVDTVGKISDKLDVMEAKNDASEMAKLKDRIAQAYRKHHETGKWTRMDKEAYDGLIKDYENHGGKNSFVHEICEPESWTWEVID